MRLIGPHQYEPRCDCNECEKYVLSYQVIQQQNIIRRLSFETLPIMRSVAHLFWILHQMEGHRMDFKTAWILYGKK